MRPRSRLKRHNNRTAAQQVFLYVLLSVLFVAGMLKFGVPAFIQGVSWMMGKDAQKASTDLTIPPQAPILGDLPVATFSSQLRVIGFAQPDLKVKLSVNGSQVDEVTTEADGGFEFDKVSLIEGVNQLTAVAVNAKNQVSAPTTVTVTVSKSAPKIEILSPEDGSTVAGVKNQNISISGKVDQKDAEVRINGNFVSLNADGAFDYRTRLNQGENSFTIVATSASGVSAEASLKVTFSP